MYLVDGNNVMGQRIGWHRDKDAARKQLLDDLVRFVQAKKIRLALVFDGVPDQRFPDGSSFRGVRVFYARQGADADARIIEMVERERNRKSLIVVTSDNALAGRVRVCGVRVLRAGEFRKMLDETLAISRISENEPAVRADEMAQWMRYFGVEEDDDE